MSENAAEHAARSIGGPDRPEWRRGLFGALAAPPRTRSAVRGRSWGSLLLHRLGGASAHTGAGLVTVGAVLAWVVVGAAIGFPGWWENVVFVLSSTITLVMLFAIQHTQSRQQSATQRKLDEIIRALPTADGRLIALEEAPDAELEARATQGRDDREQALETLADDAGRGSR